MLTKYRLATLEGEASHVATTTHFGSMLAKCLRIPYKLIQHASNDDYRLRIRPLPCLSEGQAMLQRA